MSIFDGIRTVLAPPPPSSEPLREELRRSEWEVGRLEEALSELEDSLSEPGWTRQFFEADMQFSRAGLVKLGRIATLLYLSNALIGRGVRVRGYYTWGQGVEVQARDERVNDMITAMMEEPTNAAEFFDASARLANDVLLHNEGNVFTACFTQARTGAVQLRVMRGAEIVRIIHADGDASQVRYYRREWTDGVEPKVALYPDINYRPRNMPPTVDGVVVRWDSPVAHLKAGGTKGMQFGVPVTYAAIDWARAHRDFLEDWSALMRSLARFAWAYSTKGSPATAKARLGTTYAAGANGAETNPAPVAGSVMITSEGDSLTPIPKSGAALSAGDNRELRLMVAAALDLPDHLLAGDVEVGNLATAKTLDRPTELMIGQWQKMWADYWRAIFGYAVRASVAAPAGPLTGTVTSDPVTGHQTLVTQYETTVDVTFPDVLEHDREATIGGIVAAATLDGKADAGILPRDVLVRALLVALGIEDVEGIMAAMPTEPGTPTESLPNAVRQLAAAIAESGAE